MKKNLPLRKKTKKEVKNIARNIKLLILDVDGVLTDGKLYNVPGPGGAIQDRQGRLIVPMWRSAPYGVLAIYSEDHGRTWQHLASVYGSR